MKHKSKTYVQDLHFIIFYRVFAYQNQKTIQLLAALLNQFFETHSFRRFYIVDIRK